MNEQHSILNLANGIIAFELPVCQPAMPYPHLCDRCIRLGGGNSIYWKVTDGMRKNIIEAIIVHMYTLMPCRSIYRALEYDLTFSLYIKVTLLIINFHPMDSSVFDFNMRSRVTAATK